MEKAKVYFTDFRTPYGGDTMPGKLKKLIRKAGIAQLNLEGQFVAIKIHFGELGNVSYLRPNYARAVVDVVKELGAASGISVMMSALLHNSSTILVVANSLRLMFMKPGDGRA